MTYRQELEVSIESVISEVQELLEYSKDAIGKIRINRYVKQKTVYRMNIYSALYQRVSGIIALIEAKQTNDANILLRSLWELLAAHSFVGLDKGNLHLEILQAIDSSGVKRQWSAIKRLRTDYPNANTWREQWSDAVIQERIDWAQKRLNKFTSRHPSVNLNSYERLLQRLEAVDKYNIAKYPTHKQLTQMDYRTVYSLLSEDVHSTLYGTIDNSRLSSTGITIRLDKYDLDSLRALTTAYSMLLDYTNFITRHFKLNESVSIKAYRAVGNAHHKLYKDFENRDSSGV